MPAPTSSAISRSRKCRRTWRCSCATCGRPILRCESSGLLSRMLLVNAKGPHWELAERLHLDGHGKEARPRIRNLVETGEVFDYRNVVAQKLAMDRPRTVLGAVDVERVDADY